MARPLVITLTGCMLLSACVVTPTSPPIVEECCSNPPPPQWTRAMWAWSDDAPDATTETVQIKTVAEGMLVVTPGELGRLTMRGREGQVVWTLPLPKGHTASRVIDHEGEVWVVSWSPLSSGGTIRYIMSATGAVRWEQQLRALGPQEHSEYVNELQATWVEGAVVVYGKESNGRYVEVYGSSSGQLRHLVFEGLVLDGVTLAASKNRKVRVRGVLRKVDRWKGSIPEGAVVPVFELVLSDGGAIGLACEPRPEWQAAETIEVTGTPRSRPLVLAMCQPD
ncbi:MAG: hypothetical protein ACI9MC_000977 [Kiritimatiellia bacterium]|jgi:hypothetical protein